MFRVRWSRCDYQDVLTEHSREPHLTPRFAPSSRALGVVLLSECICDYGRGSLVSLLKSVTLLWFVSSLSRLPLVRFLSVSPQDSLLSPKPVHPHASTSSSPLPSSLFPSMPTEQLTSPPRGLIPLIPWLMPPSPSYIPPPGSCPWPAAFLGRARSTTSILSKDAGRSWDILPDLSTTLFSLFQPHAFAWALNIFPW